MANASKQLPAPAAAAHGDSAWAPLRIKVFRAVWIASLLSNMGSWMHLVAAGRPDDRLPAFGAAAQRLRRVRRSEGALHWALFEDVERSGVHVEHYMMTSWIEHRRQGDRRIGADQAVLDEVNRCHSGTGPPASRYLLGHHFRTSNSLRARSKHQTGAYGQHRDAAGERD